MFPMRQTRGLLKTAFLSHTAVISYILVQALAGTEPRATGRYERRPDPLLMPAPVDRQKSSSNRQQGGRMIWGIIQSPLLGSIPI